MNDGTFPFASVIVVNHNGKNYLEECLLSLAGLNYPGDRFEVILVDNASADGSVEYPRRAFPLVRIVQLDKNYGFCRANNEGVKVAEGGQICQKQDKIFSL